jgi:hypothetical protein
MWFQRRMDVGWMVMEVVAEEKMVADGIPWYLWGR